MKKIKVFSCIGTRADIVKMSQVLNQIYSCESFESYVCLSGQHRELAYSVISEFGIHVDRTFDIMKENQQLAYVLSTTIQNYTQEMIDFKPDIVLVHGDTTTSLAGAISAAYLHICVMHIEAGLRSYSNFPFPEELHRRMITNCSTYYACPDITSFNNLVAERVDPKNIYIIGNTISDVVLSTVSVDYVFQEDVLNNTDFKMSKIVVVTLHRKELTEDALRNVCRAINILAMQHSDIIFFWPVHPNYRIKNVVKEELDGLKNVYLLNPLSVRDMHNLLYRAAIVLTDSAGVQEESFLLGKPTIVLRSCTERPEYFDSLKSKIVDPASVIVREEIEKVIENVGPSFVMIDRLSEMTGASQKITAAIMELYGGSNE